MLSRTDDVLLLEPVEWIPRQRPWMLSEEVAYALGRFFGTSASEVGRRGTGHGDFAPWNLLRTHDGWVLIDWEEASPSTSSFFDPLHYLVQGYALLGRPTGVELVGALSGRGRLGASLAAYAEGADLALGDASQALRDYLETSRTTLDPRTSDGRKGLEARTRLRARVA